MENLAAFSVREMERAALEKRERDKYFSVIDSESRNKKIRTQILKHLLEGREGKRGGSTEEGGLENFFKF